MPPPKSPPKPHTIAPAPAPPRLLRRRPLAVSPPLPRRERHPLRPHHAAVADHPSPAPPRTTPAPVPSSPPHTGLPTGPCTADHQREALSSRRPSTRAPCSRRRAPRSCPGLHDLPLTPATPGAQLSADARRAHSFPPPPLHARRSSLCQSLRLIFDEQPTGMHAHTFCFLYGV